MPRCWTRIEEDRIIKLVEKCLNLLQLKQIHAHLLINGQSQNNFLLSKFIRTAENFKNVPYAQSIFNSIKNPNAFSWNSLIRGYAQQSDLKYCEKALLLYQEMHKQHNDKIFGIQPLTFTISSVLKACSSVDDWHFGRQVHAHAFKYNFHFDVCVQTSLMDFYVKGKNMGEAEKIFNRIGIKSRDIQSWNTMIKGYAMSGDMENASLLFDKMPDRNLFTWETMISGYANFGKMEYAQKLFDALKEQGIHNIVIYTIMISGYARYGDLFHAWKLFAEMPDRDVASWNVMISSYSQAGRFDDALNLFKLMLSEGGLIKPNHNTMSMIISVCAHIGSLTFARWIEDFINDYSDEFMNCHILTALIDLHSKCGDPDKAYRLFQRFEEKDVVCYSSMISGFGIHGRGVEALQVFEQLLSKGLHPDKVCFISVLSACSHAGLVNEGRKYFDSMRVDHNISPTSDHYMCIVDLLGRAGMINDAYRVIVIDMPPIKPHAGIWGALLGACRLHSNLEIGEKAAKHLFEIEPDNAGTYVLLSNIYAKAQRWEDVVKVRTLMRKYVLRKPPGCSWIEFDGVIHKFLTESISDNQLLEILDILNWDLKDHDFLDVTFHED